MIALEPPFKADNMQGLYKKVLKGQYPKISHKFSVDIQTIVRILLQVLPKKRPTCQEILNHAIVKNKITELFPDENYIESDDDEEFKNQLLKTIYLPKGTMNIAYLTDKLPKPTYNIEFRGACTERNSYDDNKSVKSLVFPIINKVPKKKVPKIQNTRIVRKVRDAEKEQINSIKSYLKDKSKLDQYIGGMSGDSEVMTKDRSIVGESTKIDKLAPMERIANKIEELKNEKTEKTEMNIDKEYKELKELLSNQKKSKVPIIIYIDYDKRNEDSAEKHIFPKEELNYKSKSNSKSIGNLKVLAKDTDKYKNNRYGSLASKRQSSSLLESKINENRRIGGSLIYSINGELKYRGGSIISKPKRDPYVNGKYKRVEMGVIGEPIVGATPRISALKLSRSRKSLKATSLANKLPSIGDNHNYDGPQVTNPTTSRNLKLPKLSSNSSSSMLIGIYGKNNTKLNKNLKYRYGSNNRVGANNRHRLYNKMDKNSVS
jgi:hypothetical protein